MLLIKYSKKLTGFEGIYEEDLLNAAVIELQENYSTINVFEAKEQA